VLRVVADSNVLVSALIAPRGAPAELLSLWADGEFDLVVSRGLLEELSGVLARAKLRRYIEPGEAEAFVAMLAENGLAARDPDVFERASPDPSDDYVLALAVAARADVVVSGDAHLTGLENPPVPVVTPRGLLELLERS
jgi:putative PIN family toxin of toxin-antitoxin system